VGSPFYPCLWAVLRANECSSPSRAGKSPRGYASQGDDPLPCWGLCFMLRRHHIRREQTRNRIEGTLRGSPPAGSEGGLIGDPHKAAPL
jgi:hypothetical protein